MTDGSPYPALHVRLPIDTYIEIEEWSRGHPGQSASLRVEAVGLRGRGIEFLVRGWIAQSPHDLPAAVRAQMFEVERAADPALAACHRLARCCRGGVAGYIAFSTAESASAGRGFACRPGGAGADGLVDARIVGPGLRRIPLTGVAQVARPSEGWWPTASAVAVVGPELAMVEQVMAEAGIRPALLLDTRKADSIDDVMADAMPLAAVDVVISCETDGAKREALATWCDDRQRLLIEVRHGLACDRTGDGALGSSVRVQTPGTPLPTLRAAHVDGSRSAANGAAQHLPLQRHVAREVVQMLIDLTQGRKPPPARIQVRVEGRTRARYVSIETAIDDEGSRCDAEGAGTDRSLSSGISDLMRGRASDPNHAVRTLPVHRAGDAAVGSRTAAGGAT